MGDRVWCLLNVGRVPRAEPVRFHGARWGFKSVRGLSTARRPRRRRLVDGAARHAARSHRVVERVFPEGKRAIAPVARAPDWDLRQCGLRSCVLSFVWSRETFRSLPLPCAESPLSWECPSHQPAFTPERGTGDAQTSQRAILSSSQQLRGTNYYSLSWVSPGGVARGLHT